MGGGGKEGLEGRGEGGAELVNGNWKLRVE